MTTKPYAKVDISDFEREALRRRLQAEFHITALFVPVKTVANVLGLSSSTIYAYIRTGTFFLPYRLINKTPVVAIDDLVDWCLRGSVDERSDGGDRALWSESVETVARSETQKLSHRTEAGQQTPVERAIAETISQLGLMARAPKRRGR